MKNLVFILFILSSLFMGHMAYGQCNGNTLLLTQTDVDNFNPSNECIVIQGNLQIGAIGLASNITNLSSLSSVNHIDGNLSIQNLNLSNLNGLNNVYSISGDLEIRDNDNLLDLTGLDSLNFISGYLQITENDNLLNLQGLNSVDNIDEYINIQNNDALLSLNGLENIVVIREGLSIVDNDVLQSLDGLTLIEAIDGYLNIGHNGNLTNTDGLSNITYLDGFLLIEHNDNLPNIDGLSGLLHINDYLRIETNNSLLNIDGLSSLTHVYSNVMINDNNSLLNVDGLADIDLILGDLIIQFNQSLEDCCVLPLLVNIIYQELSLTSNGVTCNSFEEILPTCLGLRITAKSFLDLNQNNIKEEDEPLMSHNFSLAPLNLIDFSTNYEAIFYITTPGEYTLSMEEDLLLWEIDVPNPVVITNDEYLFNDTTLYFPLQANGDFTIQNVDLTASITRCNQTTNYWLTYTNSGTVTTDGYVQLTPAENVAFLSANPPADSTADGTLFWFYENLYPTYSNQIHLEYEMPGVSALGQPIAFEAQIQTWEGFGDKKALYSSSLVCAYDPNDKQVSPTGYTDDNYTLFGDTLEYMIRFQNTGNDTAFTVIIRDTLDESLDLNTFDFVASSHNCRTQLNLNERLVEFHFENIYLPDSFANEPGSHGFVKFSIIGKEGLAEATKIKNHAGIYFDFNPPIITNSVTNTMVSTIPNPPVLAVSPGFIDFGEMTMDEAIYSPQFLTFTNPGDQDLEVRYRLFGSHHFGVDEINEWVIEPQTTASFPVYFRPLSTGDFNDTLTLITNVGTLPILVKGTALEATGIPHLSTSDFQIYPNPNQGQFVLQAKNETPFSYKIYNTLGQLIIEQKETVANETIRLTEPGLYVVLVETTNGVWVEKVVVK